MCRAESDELTPVDQLLEDAMMMQVRGSWQDSFRKLDEAVDLDPENAVALLCLAELFVFGKGVTQNDERAAELYERAIRLCPTGLPFDPHSNLGQMYKRLDPRTNLGTVYTRLGRVHDAESCFMQAHASGTSPEAAFGLALMCKQAGDLERAEALYVEAHRGGCLEATLNLANLVFSKDVTRAEELYNEVISRGTELLLEPLNSENGKDVITTAMGQLGLIYLKKEGLRNQGRQLLLDGHLMDRSALPPNLATRILILEVKDVIRYHGCQDMLEDFIDALCSENPESVLAMMQALETAPLPLRGGSCVQLVGLESDAGQAINGRAGRVLGKDPSSGRVAVALDGEERVVKVNRANMIIIDRFPRAVLSEPGTSRRPYVAGPQEYDLHAGIEQSASEANASLMESLLRRPAEAGSAAPATISLVIMEYSRPSAWFNQALDELQARELPSGAKCIVEPDLFEVLAQNLLDREEELRGLGVEKLESRYVITEVKRQPVVEQKINAALVRSKEEMSRKKRGSFYKKRQVKLDLHLPPSSSSSSSHQQGPQAEPDMQLDRWAKHTFIQVPMPSSLGSLSSVHPQTM